MVAMVPAGYLFKGEGGGHRQRLQSAGRVCLPWQDRRRGAEHQRRNQRGEAA